MSYPGLAAPGFEISIGSTPAMAVFENRQQADLTITEIRPGTYVFHDLTQVAVGSVDLRPLTRTLRRTWQNTKDFVKHSPLLRLPAKAPGRVLYQLKEWMEFH